MWEMRLSLGYHTTMTAAINRISTDSIQSIEDMQAWARDHELREDHNFDQMQAAIDTLENLSDEHKKGIARNTKMLLVASGAFGAVLAIVTLLSGLKNIIGDF